MSDESQPSRGIQWRELFPFTHIFRAFQIAIAPSKIGLGLILILLVLLGGHALDLFWPKSALPNQNDLRQFTQSRMDRLVGLPDDSSLLQLPSLDAAATDNPDSTKVGISALFFGYEINATSLVIHSTARLDLHGVISGLTQLIAIGPGWLAESHPVYALLLSIWFLIVWSLFGGAIARIAAVQAARDEKISVREAISFSTGKILSFFFAPVMPVVIVLAGGLAIAIGATSYYASHLGLLVASIFFILTLVVGLVMSLALIGFVGGLNLMYPTIAVEGSDSFDAISRSFCYVFTRPWKMLFYSLVALVYGAICYEFLHLFVFLILKLSHVCAYLFLSGEAARTFARVWPAPSLGSLTPKPDYAHLNKADAISATIVSSWLDLIVGVLGGFVISFYFAANTIIYSLLRLEVDATELQDVYFDGLDDDHTDAVTRDGDVATVVPLPQSQGADTSQPAPTTPPNG